MNGNVTKQEKTGIFQLHKITSTGRTSTAETSESSMAYVTTAWIVLLIVVFATLLISLVLICRLYAARRRPQAGINSSTGSRNARARSANRDVRSQAEQQCYSNDPPSYDGLDLSALPKYDALPGMINPIMTSRLSSKSLSSVDFPPPAYVATVNEVAGDR